MDIHPTAFIFYGVSGSGKSTQTKLLQEYIEQNDPAHAPIVLSTGAASRKFIEEDSYTSVRARDIVEGGGLLPVFLPIRIWTDMLIEQFTGTEHIIADGLARRAHEAPVLSEALVFYDRLPAHVISLDISSERATQLLLKRGRSDDTPEEIARRIDWFEQDVKPAVEYFRDNSNFHFHKINGEQTIQEVHTDIRNAIWGTDQ